MIEAALISIIILLFFWGLKHKLSAMILASCFLEATGREPRKEEAQAASKFISQNIVKSITRFFGRKH